MHFNGHTIPFVLHKVLPHQYKGQENFGKQISKKGIILT